MNRFPLLILALICPGPCINYGYAGTVFFGEDSTSYPPLTRPNSDAARDAYVSSLATPYSTEGFERFSGGTFSGSVTGADHLILSTIGARVNVEGDRAVSGSNYLVNDPFDHPPTFSFSRLINAFGVYMIDVETSGVGQWFVRFERSNSPELARVVPIDFTLSDVDENILFFGYIDDTAFDTVTVLKSSPGDSVAFDSLTLPTPEPASAMLLAFGIPVLMRRRF